ncbi:speckle targeted PIP5K1A-regulated poly(A) polymerase [Microplitis demolitor]|uniref:speckle targeted PIP5K1A-regulated poly(A) polymerase n=1 Tax=Microplitis demolitor TaxID=69319 RepID=UPI00235B600E|nr:speckle targeted PIP5K1A-regulated poly(A) polymerase [Microplitis demolitor]
MVCRKTVSFSLRNVYEHFRSVEHSYFLMQMVQDQMKFDSVPNEFSDLHLAREMIEDKSDRHVVCYACDPVKPAVLLNNNDALGIHINERKHQDEKNKLKNNLQQFISDFNSRLEYSWYNVQRYWCVVCSMHFKLENRFHKHLNSQKHQKKCAKFVELEDFVCDFCPTCGILFYGFKNTFTYHANCRFHKYYADKSFYLITRLPTAAEELLINAEQLMTTKLEELDEEAETMRKNEQLLLDDLKNTTSNYLDVKIHPFGSRISGLGSKNSDFDIFLDYFIFFEKSRHSLKQNENIWTVQRVITDCRIPIIKLVHRPTGIDCDLSFTSGLTTENTKLIKMYLDKYPLCRKLILFIKDWINICNLSGEDGISSYTIAWMVIYYLQTKFILPSVADLITVEGNSCMISGWETGVYEDISDIINNSSFKNLLRGFFIMCAGFDYRNNIFCPLMGRPIRKKDFVVSGRLKNLPIEMLPYKNYVKKNKNLDAFRFDAAIGVQDPFDLSHNLTKAVKKSTMNRFKIYCLLSTQKLIDNK